MVKRIKKLHHDWHHRRPTSLKGSSKPENMSHVRASHHQSWHTLFGNKTPYEIAAIINTTWLDPEFLFVVEPRKGVKQ